MIRWIVFVWIIGFCLVANAQTMEERVTVYLESFLKDNKNFVSTEQLMNTKWATTDLMGSRTITFTSDGKFKQENDGFQANSTKLRGSWYINNEFVVLHVKKDKIPIYVLRNQEQIMLVDDDQIDVLKQLLTDASYKDSELKPYSYSEIFTFLNGFTIQK